MVAGVLLNTFTTVCVICIIRFSFQTITILTYANANINSNGKECPETCICLGASIDCSHKMLTTIPENMPSWTLKLNLNNNHIHRLDKEKLSNLINLEDLKLNRNKITSLTKDTFKYQKHLTSLELNRNQLERIEALSFQSLEQLTVLKLRRNHIRLMYDGAFCCLKNIDTLELDFNSISIVSRAWIYGLDHLRFMSLSNNVITQIETDVWEICKNLLELNLSSNRLGAIQKSTFKHLSQLEKLNLNNNNISHIEESAFADTPNLKVLWLNNNKLSWTVEDVNHAFVGLYNLEKFHLASNAIKSISKNAFTEVRTISTLDLSSNSITTLQNNPFAEIRGLNELFLNTSDLLCDCNLQWFAEWLQENSFTRTIAICAYPLWLRGKAIRDVPVSNFTCDDVPKPRLVEEPKMKMALKGENISLFCKAVSSSPGTIQFTWKRDNIELHNVAVSETVSSPDGKYVEHTSELKLLNVAHSDQGKYQCVAANNFGTTYSQKSRISVLIFPKFSKVPGNMTVKTNEIARLECAAHGEPPPQIAWQKDGGNDFPAARERRMHVMPTDDVFFIVNVKPVDMGVYSCTAQNLAGMIIANATLTVLEMPSFVKPMENKEVTSGESIVLECMASGSPKPTLTWLKDGGAFKATERHFFTAEDQLLIIVNTVLTDAGTYECVMNNSLGSERGFSELSVIPGTSVNEADMMGIIVITIVCCAVGTSIVWVVIIYQTRKRIHSTTNCSTLANVDARICIDATSDRSSCKDSGTDDSAKQSTVSDNFTLLPDNTNQYSKVISPLTVAGPTYSINNSRAPLLHAQQLQQEQQQHHTYPLVSGHNRRQDDNLEAFVKDIND